MVNSSLNPEPVCCATGEYLELSVEKPNLQNETIQPRQDKCMSPEIVVSSADNSEVIYAEPISPPQKCEPPLEYHYADVIRGCGASKNSPESVSSNMDSKNNQGHTSHSIEAKNYLEHAVPVLEQYGDLTDEQIEQLLLSFKNLLKQRKLDTEEPRKEHVIVEPEVAGSADPRGGGESTDDGYYDQIPEIEEKWIDSPPEVPPPLPPKKKKVFFQPEIAGNQEAHDCMNQGKLHGLN